MKKYFGYGLLTLFGVFCLLISLSISPIFFTSKAKADKATITAHRGGGGAMTPENSLSAIKSGLESRPDRIEIDIHQTKDNVLIVMHDESIDRTTTGSGNITDLTYEQIKQYPLKNEISESEPEYAPTLEELIQLINGRADLIIEIKSGSSVYPGIEKRTVELINRYNAKNWIIVHSFYDEALENIHQIDKDIILHKLFFSHLYFLPVIIDSKVHFGRLKKYSYVKEFSIFYPFANKKVIRKMHSMGKEVNVWTVDDPDKAKKLINIGINGIITDDPDLLK